MLQRSFEVWLKDFQKKRVAAFVLAPLSLFFFLTLYIRHFLYDKKWLQQKISGARVVSIGNIVAGGTGKTQLVRLLSSKLAHSMRVAILSRGYRSKQEKRRVPLLVKSFLDYRECGDEPLLLARRLPLAKVFVCRDRYLAAAEAEKEASVLILDDGMQHRRLYRDFEIVMVDAQDPFGGNRYLPWGMLRDFPKRLENADLIVSVGKLSSRDREKIASLSSASFVEAKMCIEQVQDFDGEELKIEKGEKVALFCSIANPMRFERTAKELGLEVVACRFFTDHQELEEKEILSFARLASLRGAKVVLCTEKDRVKLSLKEKELPLKMGSLHVSLEIEENKEAWERLILSIKQLVGIAI